MPRPQRDLTMPTAEDAHELRRAGVLASTSRGYDWHFQQYQRWCTEHGRQSLPSDADTLSLYLTARSDSVGHADLSQARSAVRWRHLVEDFVDPGDSNSVRRLMQTLRRVSGADPEKKPALTGDLTSSAIQAQQSANDAHSDIWLRQRAIVLVSWSTRTRLGSLARLGTAVSYTNDGNALVPVLDRDGAALEHLVLESRGDDLCPVAAVKQWLPKMHPEATRLFQTGPTGSAANMRGQRLPLLRTASLARAIPGAIRAVTRTSGADLPITRYAGDALTADQLQAALDVMRPPADLTAVRARAYVLLGCAAGVRHQNLKLLRWNDIAHDGLRVIGMRLARTKSSDEVVDLPVAPVTDADLDPYPALQLWRALTGAEDGDLVFSAISTSARPSANLGKPMTDRVGREAMDLFCRTGGLADGFTTRSMRSGRVVNALRAGSTFEQVKAITLHRYDDTVLEYVVVADPLLDGWHLSLDG